MTSKKAFTVPDLSDSEEQEPSVKPLFKAGIIIGNNSNAKEIETPVSVERSSLMKHKEISSSAAVTDDCLNAASSSTAEKRKIPQKSNCIFVKNKQRGNLLLKSLKNVNWEYSDIEPDYLMTPQTCALFLSLKYHNLYPNYIYERLKSLQKNYKLRILLLLVDVSDPNVPLKELSKVAVLSDCILMCAWSYEEAARIIETYKTFEHKSPQLIMEIQSANANGTEGNYKCAIEALSSIKSINKTDAITLISTFESLEDIIKSPPENIALCTGFGTQKAERLHQLFHRPFKRF
ncbi:DNA excision repair protein ERCC-1-like protein [Leptotrombidium deliense]|uniref:DNA excision repair protein ERCC-1-like protein n=1 Tax=Leptotrombidium deliense TaxID=299467 RepID=A0A443SQI0_9ACAR|nr:DNA excision repair protein ERCC-1-like protein [Leptotrombidium deliense]